MKFLAALQFLSTIPVPRQMRTEELGGSIKYFPLVGLIIGLILAGLNWLMLFLLPSLADLLLIIAMVIITGAMHLDGFADTCDGIAGQKSVEERWRVMHDSRSGVFGVVGIVLLLLVKYLSLSNIPARLVGTVLIFMPVVSRWSMTYAIYAYPYARPSGLGKVFKEGANLSSFVVATVITLVVAVILIPVFRLAGLAIMLLLWLIVLMVAAYLKSKFAGLTGDNYGAINEIAEVSVLIIVLLLARFGLL